MPAGLEARNVRRASRDQVGLRLDRIEQVVAVEGIRRALSEIVGGRAPNDVGAGIGQQSRRQFCDTCPVSSVSATSVVLKALYSVPSRLMTRKPMVSPVWAGAQHRPSRARCGRAPRYARPGQGRTWTVLTVPEGGRHVKELFERRGDLTRRLGQHCAEDTAQISQRPVRGVNRQRIRRRGAAHQLRIAVVRVSDNRVAIPALGFMRPGVQRAQDPCEQRCGARRVPAGIGGRADACRNRHARRRRDRLRFDRVDIDFLRIGHYRLHLLTG